MTPAEGRARRLTLFATALGSALAFLDATVVLIALPRMDESLHLGLDGQQWVYLSYSLALAALYLGAGAVGDRWGRREIFVAGVIGFAVSSALAGAAPNSAWLIVARTLQGVAGALVTTNSLALLREVYGADAGRAVGLWTALTSAATLVGPPVGGAIVEWASWRWILFLNLPLAAAAVVLARLGRSEARARVSSGRLDLPGIALVAATFGLLTYGLVQSAKHGFGSLWWTYAAAAVSFAAFIVVELRSAQPMMPLGLFRRRNFAAANAVTFLVYAGLGGFFLYVNLYVQFLGLSPFQAGLVFVPVSLMMILLAARFGSLADRHGPRAFLTGGALLMAAGLLLLLPVTSKRELLVMGLSGLVVLALGLSMLVAPITSTALSAAPSRYTGIASGVNQTVARAGGLLAVAVLGVVVTMVYDANAPSGSAFQLGQHGIEREASIDAFRACLVGAAAAVLAGAVVAALGISNAEARAEAAGV